MSEFAQLGKAIAAEVTSLFTGTLQAVHKRRTDVKLSQLGDGWTVDVVPAKHETAPADRTSRRQLYTFDIVFRRRFDPQANEETEVDPLCSIVETATDLLYDVEPTINGNVADCVSTERDPPFDPQALSKSVFLSVVRGTWTLDR